MAALGQLKLVKMLDRTFIPDSEIERLTEGRPADHAE
jgi:hypothetical protein